MWHNILKEGGKPMAEKRSLPEKYKEILITAPVDLTI